MGFDRFLACLRPPTRAQNWLAWWEAPPPANPPVSATRTTNQPSPHACSWLQLRLNLRNRFLNLDDFLMATSNPLRAFDEDPERCNPLFHGTDLDLGLAHSSTLLGPLPSLPPPTWPFKSHSKPLLLEATLAVTGNLRPSPTTLCGRFRTILSLRPLGPMNCPSGTWTVLYPLRKIIRKQKGTLALTQRRS